MTIPKAERNIRLKDELREEKSGILNWMLEGAKRYFADGLVIPDKMQQATAAAQAETDSIRPFVEERLQTCPGGKEPAGEVYNQYRVWCLMNGHHAVDAGSFKGHLQRELEFVQKRSAGGNVWVDVKLL